MTAVEPVERKAVAVDRLTGVRVQVVTQTVSVGSVAEPFERMIAVE